MPDQAVSTFRVCSYRRLSTRRPFRLNAIQFLILYFSALAALVAGILRAWGV